MGISLRPDGMTSAASALRYWERRQEVASNNLANVSTTGFKGERAFARMLDAGTPVIDAATDLRAGALRPTGAPLDLAMGGDGFLVVDTPDGERLTRGGAFRLDDQRRIVTANGEPLLGETGELVLDSDSAAALEGTLSAGTESPDGLATALVQIDRQGGVRVAGREVGRLRVERVAEGDRLQHAGAGLFVPPDGREPVPDGERDVRQGALEESNVSPISALVEMITVQRAYASVQKAMTTLDAARGTITSDLGKPV